MYKETGPCYKCTKRYLACQDTCTDPEYLKFKEKILKRHEYEQKKREEASIIHESIKRGGRYGSLPQSKAKG